MKLFIRNMACESCKVVVRKSLISLKLQPVKVELGEIQVKGNISPEKKKEFNSMIKKVGLEVVENKGGILIEKIKKCIWDYARSSHRPVLNLSDYLVSKLKYDYNYLSNLFTEIESQTISNYYMALKTEFAKEMLLFGELSLTEISKRLHYSHPSHFTAQFKKQTGFAPSYYKNLKEKRRLAAHELSAK
jgi:AraC-like DNA-binding protein